MVNWVPLPALRVPSGRFGVTRIFGAGGIAVGAPSSGPRFVNLTPPSGVTNCVPTLWDRSSVEYEAYREVTNALVPTIHRD